uniref:XS domain containing protein-like n=1 Tax=Oryza rufipogon TaxID=4529 RepID=A0A679BBG3_ORYRU|nr:XS domain containing protein-like [Oryza rufipogon]
MYSPEFSVNFRSSRSNFNGTKFIESSDKQSTRLLPCSPAFPVDAHFNLHLMASDFLAILALKPGMDLTGTDIPTPGVSTPAPARDESQEALIIPTGRGEACDRPPVAT